MPSTRLLLCASALLFAGAQPGSSAASTNSAADIDGTRAIVERLVSVQRELARTRADWTEEQALLNQSRELLRADLARLRTSLAEFAAETDHTVERTRKLESDREADRAAARAISAALAPLEARLIALAARFPEPLQSTVAPLLRRIPRDPAITQAALGERMQNLVGILSQADQFNRTITRRNEVRSIPGAGEIEVAVFYWGLGAAYAVDRSGRHAFVGRPAASGWVFESAPDLGDAILRLAAIQEGRREVEFVALPVALAR